MDQTAILWPMIAHVALVCIVYTMLGWRRRIAVQGGSANPDQFKLRTKEPEVSAAVSNNLTNQFELPVLFHVLCLALFVTHGASYLTVVLAWLFVLLRYVHTFIHVTSNDLRYRSPAFAAGFLVLVVMWVLFALHLLGAA